MIARRGYPNWRLEENAEPYRPPLEPSDIVTVHVDRWAAYINKPVPGW